MVTPAGISLAIEPEEDLRVCVDGVRAPRMCS